MKSGRGYRVGEIVTLDFRAGEVVTVDYDEITLRWLLSKLLTGEELEVMRERAIERYGFWLGSAAEDCE